MSESPVHTLENKRKMLKFRAWHRGTREMDLIMGSFADLHIETFDAEALSQFEALLTNNDPDLYNWICGREFVPDEEKNPVMDLLLQHRFAT